MSSYCYMLTLLLLGHTLIPLSFNRLSWGCCNSSLLSDGPQLPSGHSPTKPARLQPEVSSASAGGRASLCRGLARASCPLPLPVFPAALGRLPLCPQVHARGRASSGSLHMSPVFAPLHTPPLWGDRECPLSPGQRNQGVPRRLSRRIWRWPQFSKSSVL